MTLMVILFGKKYLSVKVDDDFIRKALLEEVHLVHFLHHVFYSVLDTRLPITRFQLGKRTKNPARIHMQL